jgi:hypothetical protein
MSRLHAACALATALVLVAASASFVAAAGGAKLPPVDPQDLNAASQERQAELTETQILARARSRIGTAFKDMRPAWLPNYVLDPSKPLERFSLPDHARMPDNERGVFVIDKRGEHIGVWASDAGTIIHSSPEAERVVEEPLKVAKRSFPNGWRRIGPHGRMSVKVGVEMPLPSELMGKKRGGRARDADL